jgi:hypothetical protein
VLAPADWLVSGRQGVGRLGKGPGCASEVFAGVFSFGHGVSVALAVEMAFCRQEAEGGGDHIVGCVKIVPDD